MKLESLCRRPIVIGAIRNPALMRPVAGFQHFIACMLRPLGKQKILSGCYPRSSLGMLPPFSASFCRTVLWSHIFICAESPIFSFGYPSSIASPFRASRLLSKSRSLSRSTIDVFQLSFCEFDAARLSSFATTSTRVMPGTAGFVAEAAGGAAVALGRGAGLLGAAVAVGRDAGLVGSAVSPKPSLSRIELNRLIAKLHSVV